MVRKSGPKPDREQYTVLGKYLDDALTLAKKSQAEFARQAGVKAPVVSKVLTGKQTVISRKVLLRWCAILQCPEWLEGRILNAAGHASDRQIREAEALEEETHQRVLEEVQKKQGE